MTIEELQIELARTRAAMDAAMRLMYAWKKKYRMEREMQENEQELIKTEHELFMRIREVGNYGGNEGTASDQNGQADA